MFDRGSENYRSDLKLGERYYDKGTGVEGILVALTFYEHACERGTLRFLNGQGEVCSETFDAPELIHVETGRAATTKKAGGPDRPVHPRPDGRRV